MEGVVIYTRLGLLRSYFPLLSHVLVSIKFCFCRGWDVIILDSALILSLVRSTSPELLTPQFHELRHFEGQADHQNASLVGQQMTFNKKIVIFNVRL